MIASRAAALAVLLAAIQSAACSGPGRAGVPAGPDGPAPYVVLVSFDGMRYDFLDRTSTPNFRRVAEAGVRATGLIPGYPSKTFPNHYTMATGLYPAHHGLVDNVFYDPALDATFSYRDIAAVREARWYGGEPIWVTAETQGLPTAAFFWVGSEAPIQDAYPTDYKAYDGSVPFSARVDTVLAWLARPRARRPRLVMLYFEEPDGTAHRTGPDHPAVDSIIRQLDGHLGRLLDGIDRLPIADRVHVVLVSDHGMAPVPRDRVIRLDDRVDLDGVRTVYNTSQALLYFDGDSARAEAVYRTLAGQVPHARVFRRAETPARWHYREGRRIGDLVVAADPGWIIRAPDRPWNSRGMHGWDPYHRAMHGVFLAAGPRIRENVTVPAFENVHLYPFLAALLDLEPAPGIDGDPAVLAPVLRHTQTAP